MLKVDNIHFSYGRTPILQEVSASFNPGRLTALIGPNGCGKSTLIKAMTGLLPLQSGQITLDDQPISALPRKQLAQRLAYLPQDNHCPDYLTLGELVEMGGYARQPLIGREKGADRTIYLQALETVGLAQHAHRQVNALSGGQRQRAFIAMILAQDAEILLLDEPVNHLDVTYQYGILELIRELVHSHGKTVVTVLHDLNLALSFADEALMMAEGRVIAAGPTAEVITQSRVRQVFALDADFLRQGERLVCVPRLSGQPPPFAPVPKGTAAAPARQV